MCMLFWLHLCLREGIGSPGTAIADSCELPVGTGNWTRVFRKNSQCCNHWAILKTPTFCSLASFRGFQSHTMMEYVQSYDWFSYNARHNIFITHKVHGQCRSLSQAEPLRVQIISVVSSLSVVVPPLGVSYFIHLIKQNEVKFVAKNID